MVVNPIYAARYRKQCNEMIKEYESNPFVSQPLSQIAACYEKRGKHIKAIELYQKTLDQAEEKNDPSVIVFNNKSLGDCYYELKEYGEAVSYYQQALSYQPQYLAYYELHRQLGKCYAKLHGYEKAKEQVDLLRKTSEAGYYEMAEEILNLIPDKQREKWGSEYKRRENYSRKL